VVGFDLGTNTSRLDLVMEPDEVARLTLETGDIGDLAALEAVLDRHGITRVIHLAALQLPFCRADPPRGAYVNVLGTANVFEAVKRRAGQIQGPLVLASTAAVYEPVTPGHEDDVPGEDVCTRPMSHYGVYKVANEGTARVYWADEGVASVALRPYTVYGPARDQGVTAAPTIALATAMKGEKAHIPYGGRTHFNYAPDVARALIAAMRSGYQGALSANLAGAIAGIDDFVAAIEAALPEAKGLVTHDPQPFALPPVFATGAFEALVGGFQWTSLQDGVQRTVDHFRRRPPA
jgi:nucleoside-diphosphate-sugar epimerase